VAPNNINFIVINYFDQIPFTEDYVVILDCIFGQTSYEYSYEPHFFDQWKSREAISFGYFRKYVRNYNEENRTFY